MHTFGASERRPVGLCIFIFYFVQPMLREALASNGAAAVVLKAESASVGRRTSGTLLWLLHLQLRRCLCSAAAAAAAAAAFGLLLLLLP